MDYPAFRELEQNKDFLDSSGKKYYRVLKTTSDTPVPVYVEIPFAIFAKVPDYTGSQENRKDFVCLASVFNDTFYKTKDDVVEENEVFHCFVDSPVARDRWEMAKLHMASTDLNDFTLRVHLGMLHFASSVYTTAFYNLSRTNKALNWLYDEFINVFSWGLLQVNFTANLTLVDHKRPVAERLFYLNF